MSPDLSYVLSKAGSVVKGSLSSLFAVNMLISVFMAVSLKSMWQLMNLCQVICFISQLFELPAIGELTISFLSNVVDMKFIPTDWAKTMVAN